MLSFLIIWAIVFYTNKFDKDQKNWIGSKIASEATRVIHGQTWKYLFQMQLIFSLPPIYGDSLAQIYPRHVIHGRDPMRQGRKQLNQKKARMNSN